MFYIKKYYRKFLLIFFILLIILFIFFISKFNNNQIEEIDINVNEEKNINDKKDISEEKIKNNKFNIKGAVVNPGVYEFSDGERVIDAIEKSGGLLENADTSIINLSKNLFDEMVIFIYTIDEVNEMKGENIIIQYVEKECNCPKILNDACIVNNENEKNEEIRKDKISLNSATLEEIQTLTGIGKSKAEAIIKYREENNGFKYIDEIMNISGIGESIFEKIKDNITI